MRRIWIAALLAWTAPAQTVVSPSDTPAAANSLKPHEGEKTLRCEVEPSKPVLNFGFRFQAGYVLQVPLIQSSGSGHVWKIVLGITPEGRRETTYVADRIELPPILRPEYTGETSGTFLLGGGHYRVQFAASDDGGRVCRKEWELEARLSRYERSVKPAMPPETAGDLSWGATAITERPTGAPRRITVLVNSSPPYTPRFHTAPLIFQPRVVLPRYPVPIPAKLVDNRAMLLGIMASLLEKLPGASIRLVVFDLDQQREIYRQDGFTLKEIDKAAHAANELEHWAVDYHELQNQPGRWGLLANLIHREADAQLRSDIVLFLGPRNGSAERMPSHFPGEMRAGQRFVYLQYRLSRDDPYTGILPEMTSKPGDMNRPISTSPISADLPDSIESAVARLKGKTCLIYSPVDFEKAMKAVRR